ncbi:hypothetical protein [Aliiruegeria lutimaris]|uniref:Uncharacterized protein n=1 Tax=Aliiruegeria lutimaris TaxID=571298 RepID=A0A1G8K396_9RHOB|nr:hypothetical protein [Aliiruegeria lutimaris]SDI37921.1 hypothetical protein SAMN04488026_1002134 [Aliiruegeria lutimaris]
MAGGWTKLAGPPLERVAAIFRENEVRRINFEIAGLAIQGVELAEVGEALRIGKVKCFIGPVPGGDAHAVYHQGHNAIVLQTGFNTSKPSLRESGIIVHEGVHALNDLRKWKNTSRGQDEAAAYLAEAIYYKNNKLPEPATYGTSLVDEAFKLATLYRMETGSIKLSWKEILPFMIKIRSKYRSATDPFNITDKVLADG